MKTYIKEFIPPIFIRLLKKAKPDPGNLSEEAPGQEMGADFYDRALLSNPHYLCHYTKSRWYPLWAVLADRIMRDGVQAVLDLGCGPGQVAQLLRDRGLTRYTGVDFSGERVIRARMLCSEFDFVQEDIRQTNLLDSCPYDAVVCSEVLEHIEEDNAVLAKIRKGSLFYGAVPNFSSKTHVRHFNNVDEVTARYGGYFSSLTVDWMVSNPERKGYFLMTGCK